MDVNFELIMVVALVVCGVIWAIDAIWIAPRRRDAAAKAQAAAGGQLAEEKLHEISKESTLVEYARSFFPVILIVLLLRSFLVEPFRIPSGSMIPTLWEGDFILVNKYAYGLRLPVLGTKVASVGEPQRGDIIVFRFPQDPSIDYIKRVIGLPGDRISYHDKVLYINGEPAQQRSSGVYTEVTTGIPFPAQLQEEWVIDKEHMMVIHPDYRSPLDDGEWWVPAGTYFVMGDNRDNSNDSRAWGFVPEQNLVGRAFFIWMSLGKKNGFAWQRIGTKIR